QCPHTLRRGRVPFHHIHAVGGDHRAALVVQGHPAADGAIAVGAVSATIPGASSLQPYSSRGPSSLYTEFGWDQSPVRVNTLAGVAVDDVETRIGQLGYFDPDGTGRFTGTSAAAPHVAGIAALLLQARPWLTPAEVRSALNGTAIDIGASGYDRDTGHGRFDALNAVYSVLTPAPPDLAASSDSGWSNTDDYTNVTTPTFTGTAPADSLVLIYADGLQVGDHLGPVDHAPGERSWPRGPVQGAEGVLLLRVPGIVLHMDVGQVRPQKLHPHAPRLIPLADHVPGVVDSAHQIGVELIEQAMGQPCGGDDGAHVDLDQDADAVRCCEARDRLQPPACLGIQLTVGARPVVPRHPEAHHWCAEDGGGAHDQLGALLVVAGEVGGQRGYAQTSAAGQVPQCRRLVDNGREVHRAAVVAPEGGRLIRSGRVDLLHPPLDAVVTEAAEEIDRLPEVVLGHTHGKDGDFHGEFPPPTHDSQEGETCDVFRF
ncbi:MAG: S8 family serine peptidase, partial [Anaerolineae bacterium]|nr:S8 family serine peptidase [Anaerolineae bacterium]